VIYSFVEGWSRKSEKILTIEFILSFGKSVGTEGNQLAFNMCCKYNI